MRSDLYWVPTPAGKLAVAPRPRGGDWLPDEISAWHRAGVALVVSLLTPDEVRELELAGEPAACAACGVEFAALPIPDYGVPVDVAPVRELVRRIADALTAGRAVLVHCRQGIGRAGMVAVATLRHLGVSADDALRAVSDARGRPVPETPDQLRWVREFAPEHQKSN